MAKGDDNRRSKQKSQSATFPPTQIIVLKENNNKNKN